MTYSEEMLPNGVRQITLVGVLDSNVAMNRGEELREYVTNQGGSVLLDLAGLEYLSSSGIRVLLLCAKDLHEADGTLYLAAPQPRVMSVITIAGYVPTFPVYQTVEEALQVLSG
jgi:anti-anti-sigma factor